MAEVRDIIDAASKGEIGTLEALLKAQPALAGAHAPDGFLPLAAACYWGRIEAARLLLDHGADANAPTRDGFLDIRPLGAAVATPDVPNPSDDEEVVVELCALLIDRGADVNGRRRDGLTALHAAAWRGHLKVIALLLAHGADRTIRGESGPHAGQTAAETALSQDQAEAARLLRL